MSLATEGLDFLIKDDKLKLKLKIFGLVVNDFKPKNNKEMEGAYKAVLDEVLSGRIKL